jgi:hypothetical protein
MWLASALHAESTITITLVNNSDHAFKVSRIATSPGARLAIDHEVIEANTTAIIAGTIVADVDLAGSIYFNNDSDRLHVNVRRLKHFGQPNLTMHSEDVQSMVDPASLKFNPSGKPNDLSHTAVTVMLQ